MIIALIGADYGRIDVDRGSLLFKIENVPDVFHIRYVWTNRTSCNVGEWYHFVAIIDANDHSENMLSINGVDDTSSFSEVPDNEPIHMRFSAEIRIGGKDTDYFQLSSERYFDGLIDDIRICRQKLSVANIADLYATGDEGLSTWTYSVRWIDAK